MRKLLCSLCLCALCIGFAAPAMATDNIEFSSIRCYEFIDLVQYEDEETVGYIFMWLDGYLSGVSGDTYLNWYGAETYTERIIDHCARFGNDNFLSVARRYGIQ